MKAALYAFVIAAIFIFIAPDAVADSSATTGLGKNDKSASASSRPARVNPKSEPRWNCVSYARQETRLELAGDAWRWWSAANGRLERGGRPAEGVVLVFKSSGSMTHGHVAIVAAVHDERTILLRHANWSSNRGGKGRISTEYARDVSVANDWSMVRIEHRPSQSYGRSYPTYGFIMPERRVAALTADDQR